MSYVVTDKLDYSCLRSCPEDSVYCTSAGSGIPSVPHLTEQVEVCLDNLYVYIAYQSDFAITVSTDFVGDLPCEGIERDLKNYCMMVPNNECTLDYCMKGCGLLQCQEDVGAGKHLEIFTMCLPMHTGSKERKRRCEAVNSTYRIHDRWDNCSS